MDQVRGPGLRGARPIRRGVVRGRRFVDALRSAWHQPLVTGVSTFARSLLHRLLPVPTPLIDARVLDELARADDWLGASDVWRRTGLRAWLVLSSLDRLMAAGRVVDRWEPDARGRLPRRLYRAVPRVAAPEEPS